MERRELFSSLFSPKKKEDKEIIIRPPYYNNIGSFAKECVKCETAPCSTLCEENIIKIGEDKLPFIDFKEGGCTYCDECAKVCPADVLNLEYKKYINVKVEIDVMKCVSWHNTMCFSCKDPCLDDAIDFLAMFRPSINDKCTSCGFCLEYCPTQAITIKQKEI